MKTLEEMKKDPNKEENQNKTYMDNVAAENVNFVQENSEQELKELINVIK